MAQATSVVPLSVYENGKQTRCHQRITKMINIAILISQGNLQFGDSNPHQYRMKINSTGDLGIETVLLTDKLIMPELKIIQKYLSE